MKAVLQYAASPEFRERLAALGADGIEIAVVAEPDKAKFAEQMRDADVLLHVLEPVTEAVIAGAPELKLIQKIGVGVNTIDLEAAKARGIAVCNMPGSNAAAVAEMTLALMLAVLRRTVVLDARTRAGEGWRLDGAMVDSFGEIGGRTVGLVGYGAVPRHLAPALAALGARVLYTARAPKDDAAGEWRTLDDLLAQSDIVSLHVPETDETSGLIDAPAIERMRAGAVLINTARGGLVDEPALVAALESGRLRGAGLDVFAREPVDPANPLLALDTVVATPHLAWLTPETLDRSLSIALDNMDRLASGEALLNRVV